MKQTLLVVFAFIATIGIAQTIEINKDSSTVKWEGFKVGGAHDGHIDIKSSELSMTENGGLAGTFVIDMNSMVCDDLGEGMAKKLEGHLKNEDFFDVENHPEASMEIVSAKMFVTQSSTHTIKANLTIKEITHEITFPVTVTVEEGVFVASSSFSIDRTQWKIEYASKSIFTELKERYLYDNIDFDIELQGTIK